MQKVHRRQINISRRVFYKKKWKWQQFRNVGMRCRATDVVNLARLRTGLIELRSRLTNSVKPNNYIRCRTLTFSGTTHRAACVDKLASVGQSICLSQQGCPLDLALGHKQTFVWILSDNKYFRQNKTRKRQVM